MFRSWVIAGRRFLTVEGRGANILVVAILIAASVIPFAFTHQIYGEGNVIHALGGGLVFALLALRSRSGV